MNWCRGMAVALALAVAGAIAGCGVGPGETVGAVELTVTRDYGAEQVIDRQTEEAKESDTVLRLLDRSADISTRYGGRFVESIEGIDGRHSGGRLHDWFFYVNGVWSAVGAGDYSLLEGDRVWWDYRDWTAAMRVPVVVGSWPAPFADGYEGERHPTAVICIDAGPACAEVSERLADAGANLTAEDADEAIRVLVGPWEELRDDPAAKLIEAGPSSSGVFADLQLDEAGWRLVTLDRRGSAAQTLGPGTGFVAVTRAGDEPPTWLVTGTDRDGVETAAKLLDEDVLTDRYAIAARAVGDHLDLRLFALPAG